MAIRKHADITGIKVGDIEHRISLYADDVILFCSRLEKTLPGLLKLMKTFGTFSDYKINNSKSVIMFLTENERNSPPISTPFTVSKQGFTYLGVRITPTIDKMISVNYDPLVENVTQLINRWTKLPISLIGRINILKMYVHFYTYSSQFHTLQLLPSLNCLTKHSQTSFGITNGLDSDFPCCIYHMTEVDCNFRISYGTFGQHKLGPVCSTLSMTTPQLGLQWNRRISQYHYICTCIRQIEKSFLKIPRILS